MDNYKPFQISILNNDDVSEKFNKTSDEGRIYVRIGSIEISIKQTDDGRGICLDAYKAASPLEDLGSLYLLYKDAIEPFTEKVKLCTCNNCGNVFEDTNPLKESEEYELLLSQPSLEKLYEEISKPETGYWGCPVCCTDQFLVDNINWNALTEIQTILLRKQLGKDCTEEESAFLKQWLKQTLLTAEDNTSELERKIQLLFPLEYGEYLDEVEKQSKYA